MARVAPENRYTDRLPRTYLGDLDGEPMKSDFYVYLHRRASDGEIFYVGKGNRRRAWYFKERNSHWTRTFEKYGCEVEIFAGGLSEKDAFDLERTLIEHCQSDILTNKSTGGEGPTGYRFTDEQKARLSASHIGQKQTAEQREAARLRMLGRVPSDNERALARERMLGNNLGSKRRITPELRAKLSRSNGSGRSPHTDRTEYVFEHLDGRVFRGTRWQLKALHGDCVRALFYTTPNRSVYGWRLGA